MSTYRDKWKCPKGHVNYTYRRTSSAGRQIGTTCCHRDCNWKTYVVTAGPVPKPKGGAE